jgi:urease accessory protein
MDRASGPFCHGQGAAGVTSSPPSAGLHGHLHMEAALRPDGQTALAGQSFRAPFHIGKPYWDGRVLQVRVVNPTAGILAGDRLALDVRVGPGAALLVMTPAATRAFMMENGVAECRQDFSVEPDGWLEYASEPLFPHRESDYAQTTRIRVADGAEAYFVEALAPGRAGRGELWAWRDLKLTLSVTHAEELILRERLAGSGAALARRAALHGGAEAWFATIVIISQKLAPDDCVWEKVRALHRDGRWVGATRLRRGGWIVRVVAPGSQSLRDALSDLRSIFSEKLPHLQSDLRRV